MDCVTGSTANLPFAVLADNHTSLMHGWVPAVVQAWYPGQEGGVALAELLFGGFSPSGKLPVTFERRWEDSAVHDSYYPQREKRIAYSEGVFLGYRHFDRAQRESDGRPLRPWVIRIAHNLASNYYRDRSRRPQTPLDSTEPIAARHDTVAIAEGREELRQVMANLEHLSDDRREALIMRFALGMDNREIARALGRSDGATKVLIHRAIKQLQEEMSDD